MRSGSVVSTACDDVERRLETFWESKIQHAGAHNLLIKDPASSKSFILIASRRETNHMLNLTFKEHLFKLAQHTYHVSLKIEIDTPQKEKSLQIVDFASWAIFRKYERGDESYYAIIQEKIVEESVLYP